MKQAHGSYARLELKQPIPIPACDAAHPAVVDLPEFYSKCPNF